jgi:hypothetical protein
VGLVPSPLILSQDEMGRIAAPIFTSVGQDAVNGPGDVFIIQSLLNDRLPKPHTPLAVTGIADPGTILAIQAFQAVVMNMNPPTGHVDPGSATYYALAARPLVGAPLPPISRFGHIGVVPADVLDAAIASKRRWSVPVCITLAQWVVESAWGAAMPPDSNNPFGIKAAASQDAVESLTREVIDGASTYLIARFRKFSSLSEAFDLHGQLLATGGVYRQAMAMAADPDRFADALTGVYASDPKYGDTLKWVMNNYGFKQYDK